MSPTNSRPPVVPDCEQTVRRLWDYLDGEIGERELAAIDAHLAACEPCTSHYTFERRFLEAIRSVRDSAQTDDAEGGQLRDRVIRTLVAAGELRTPGYAE